MPAVSADPRTSHADVTATLEGVHATGATTPAVPAVVETHGLSKRYGDVLALDALDLRVPERTVVGFLGPNGAGKTTAMKLLVGLQRPSAGSARVFGLDVASRGPEVRTRVGYLAQDPRFYEHLTPRETLRFVARFFYAGPAAAIERRIDELLALVDLSDKADRPVRGFSGGERQRLGIAQASVNDPALLLMDEPAAALDPAGRQAVLGIIERLRERTTVFFSTHILDDVQRVADRVAILDRGRLIAHAPTHELLAGDGVSTFELGMRGDADAVAEALRGEAWVDAVDVALNGGRANGAAGNGAAGNGADATQTLLHVRVHDAGAAEALLLRRVLAIDGVVVTRFATRRYELEEVFLRLVQGARGQA